MAFRKKQAREPQSFGGSGRGFIGKINREPLKGGSEGQTWRQGGWEEATAEWVFLPLPRQICPPLSPSSRLWSHFDSSPRSSPRAASRSPPTPAPAGDGTRMLAIHSSSRPSMKMSDGPSPHLNTSRGHGGPDAGRSLEELGACHFWVCLRATRPQAWVVASPDLTRNAQQGPKRELGASGRGIDGTAQCWALLSEAGSPRPVGDEERISR